MCIKQNGKHNKTNITIQGTYIYECIYISLLNVFMFHRLV